MSDLDPNARAKRKQRLVLAGLIMGILGLAGIGIIFFDNTPASPAKKPETVNITAPGTVDEKDAWRAQQVAQEKSNEMQIHEVKSLLKQQEETNTRLAKELSELREQGRAQKSDNTLAQTLPNMPANPQQILPPPGPLNAPLTQTQDTPVPKRELEVISFTSVADADKAKEIIFLPAGSFVRVAMLNGVDAPTGGQAQGNPLPVAFHVLDVANLANKHHLDIKDCRFIAAAWGDLSAERMMARTESLTCIINGETIEMQVKGQVVGEDGKTGVRGRLVTKQGQMLANALLAGALSGIGSAIQQSATVTSVGGGGVTQTFDGDKIGKAAIGGSVNNAATMLAQYYLKAADKLYPVIETDGGRTVEILVTKAATFKGTAAAYQNLLRRTERRQQRG